MTFDDVPYPATLIAIPDTGADINAISLRMTQKLGLDVHRTETMLLHLIHGMTARCCGVITLNCRFGRGSEPAPERFNCVFYVFRKMASPLIISREFLDKTETLTRHRDRLSRLTYSPMIIPVVRTLADTQQRLLCSLDGEDLEGFPDTGSDVDVMSFAYAKKRRFPIQPTEAWIMFADKTVRKACGICIVQVAVGYGAVKMISKKTVLFANEDNARSENGRTEGRIQEEDRHEKDEIAGLDNKGQENVRTFIESEMYVLKDAEFDVLLGTESLEALKVYTRHTDCLVMRPPRYINSIQFNRIELLGPVGRGFQQICRKWLSRRRNKKELSSKLQSRHVYYADASKRKLCRLGSSLFWARRTRKKTREGRNSTTDL
jgi:hypothetical protein